MDWWNGPVSEKADLFKLAVHQETRQSRNESSVVDRPAQALQHVSPLRGRRLRTEPEETEAGRDDHRDAEQPRRIGKNGVDDIGKDLGAENAESPAPGDPPFVEIGKRVRADDTVCLIEVMKLFSSINAGVDGVVTRILVENGTMVEFGQMLIVIAASP